MTVPMILPELRLFGEGGDGSGNGSGSAAAETPSQSPCGDSSPSRGSQETMTEGERLSHSAEQAQNAADTVIANQRARWCGNPSSLASPSGGGGPSEGRDGEGDAADAPAADVPDAPDAPDDGKARAFRALIRGEYREQYAAETQKLINRRFRALDERVQAQQGVLDLLAARWDLPDADAATLCARLQSELSAQQRAEADAQQREAAIDAHARAFAERRCSAWAAEAEALRAKDPDFSLEEMRGNRVFTLLLGDGYPMEAAYRAAAVDAIERRSALRAQRAVAEDIRARGSRPAEAGAAGTPAFGTRGDVSRLSDREVLDILGRIADRERVSFG